MSRTGSKTGAPLVQSHALPDFPAPASNLPPLGLTADARRRHLALRAAAREDLPFLRALYREIREPELAAAAWPEALREAFCTRQFDLQHTSFVSQFPRAAFLVVEQHGIPIGRLYIDREPGGFHLVEIALASSVRRQGHGSLLLDSVKRDACRRAVPRVTLQVERSNAQARRLYERHGFRPAGQEGRHVVMCWHAPKTEGAKRIDPHLRPPVQLKTA